MPGIGLSSQDRVIGIASSKEIDCTIIGTHIIVPIDNAKIYPVNFVFFELTQLTGVAGTWPTISLGQNASSYDNILVGTSLAAMTIGGNVAKVVLGNLPFFDISSNPIYVNVSVASTDYTAMKMNVYMGMAKQSL